MRKSTSQYYHTRRRVAERYGLFLPFDCYRDLVRQVHDGSGRFLEKKTNRISIWEITLAGKKVRAAYDRRRGTIATVI